MLGPTTRADVHLPTVLAIGVVSFAAVTVIHEAGGHGLACILVGGKTLAVSSTELRCDGPEDGARLVVTAAGSIANIVIGLAAMAAGIALGPARGVWSYVLWLFGATNLFHAGMYMLIGPLTGFGDWSSVARNVEPILVWTIGITVLGYWVNVVGSRLARRPVWQPLAGVEEQERETRMRLLTRLPLAAALVVSLAAGLLSPLQPRYALVTSLLAPLVLLLLVRLPSWPERDPPAPPVRIASWAWVVAGVVVGLGFVLVLGPGLGSGGRRGSSRGDPRVGGGAWGVARPDRGRFVRAEPRRRVLAYLRGLLGNVGRKHGRSWPSTPASAPQTACSGCCPPPTGTPTWSATTCAPLWSSTWATRRPCWWWTRLAS